MGNETIERIANEAYQQGFKSGVNKAVAFLEKRAEVGLLKKDTSRLGLYLTATDFGMARKLNK